MVAKLKAPRAIWVMPPAGKITEATLAELAGLVGEGDTLIDGGNAFWKDDVRRARNLAPRASTTWISAPQAASTASIAATA